MPTTDLIRPSSALRPYQAELADRLYREFGEKPGALLAIKMSLGKTAIVGTVVRRLLDTFQVRKVLIVAPLRVAQKTWPDEFNAWAHLRPLRWVSLCGTKIGQKVTPKQRAQWLADFLADPLAEIAIVNRENVTWLYEALGGEEKWPFDMMVYDESSRLKAGSKRTASRRLSEFGVYAKVRKRMAYVIEMSGTPTPHGLTDLWGQIAVIDQGHRLGTKKTAFLSRWFDSDYMGWKHTPKPGAEAEIMSRVSDIMLSLDDKDHLKLPKVTPDNIMVDLGSELMADYRRFKRELALEEHDIVAVNRGVLTFKLLQFANGSVYRTDEDQFPPVREIVPIHTRKLDAFEKYVRAHKGDNILVAYSFHFDRDAILSRFPYAQLANEPGVLDEWNRGRVKICLAHPASIGHGMNIQFGGHRIVWYGLPASLELYLQFNARLPRPGQPADEVFIDHILARGTYDESLIALLGDRDVTQQRITESVKLHLRGHST